MKWRLTGTAPPPSLPLALPMTTPSRPRDEFELLIPLALVALWGQLFYAAVPIWRFGEYYSFGWFVPPLAISLFLTRWRKLKGYRLPTTTTYRYILLALVLLPALGLLRAVEAFDTSWRPALLLQGVLVVGASHLLLFWRGGWRLSLGMTPVTIYALTALPYPWQFEQELIRRLTGLVINISGELFNVFGRPVHVVGETLESMGKTVEVTEGCSGIRSFQNLVMAALFLGEHYLLGWLPRLLLFGMAGVVAVVANTWRAMTLARISFDQSEDAFHQAHDRIGYISFAAGIAILVVAAILLSAAKDRRRGVLKTTITTP